LAGELSKLKYQVRTIGEAVDYQDHPLEALIIAMDWGEEDIDCAHDVFEKYDSRLEAGEQVNWHEFKREFEECI